MSLSQSGSFQLYDLLLPWIARIESYIQEIQSSFWSRWISNQDLLSTKKILCSFQELVSKPRNRGSTEYLIVFLLGTLTYSSKSVCSLLLGILFEKIASDYKDLLQKKELEEMQEETKIKIILQNMTEIYQSLYHLDDKKISRNIQSVGIYLRDSRISTQEGFSTWHSVWYGTLH